MWRMAAIAYMFAVAGANGNSNGASGMAAAGTRGAVPVAWPSERGRPRQRDQCDLALAERNGLGGVGDVDDVGRPAGVGRVHVAELQAQVVGHRERPEPGRVARAEVAVHVVLAEPRVLERAPGDFGVELRHRLVVGLARRMLEGARDVGLALDRHRRAAPFSSTSGFNTLIGLPAA